jgi:hypothetical protein
MAKDRIPKVRVYVREKGGRRSFYPAPQIPDLTACYWLRYEKDQGQAWQRVGHYDLVAKEKLLLERRLSAQAQGFILPEDRAAEKASTSRVTIRAGWETPAPKAGVTAFWNRRTVAPQSNTSCFVSLFVS